MIVGVEKVSIPLRQPLVITGYSFSHLETVRVALERNGVSGRGEGTGSYYLGENQDSIVEEIMRVGPLLREGAGREDLQNILPVGGARNALDCALWDLECKETKSSIWHRLNLEPKKLTTVATIGVGEASEMARHAARWRNYHFLKVKLSDDAPVEKIRAVREARPDASIVVDANQAWSFDDLLDFLPSFEELEIEMIEQPLRRGHDDKLAGLTSPVPIGADESCLGLEEFWEVQEKYDVINIKLDKCGGLTEALLIVDAARKLGKTLMVGNMTGTSLSMAPSFVVGQSCQFVDLDGPLLLQHDIENGLRFSETGEIFEPRPELWG